MYYSNSNFDKLFDGFFNNWNRPMINNSTAPTLEKEPYEVNYTKDGAYLNFEVPGFNKETLKVELEDGVIYIDGKRKYKLNGEEVEKTITKTFRVGKEYDPSTIEATIEDGILTIFVNNYKKPEKKKRISLL